MLPVFERRQRAAVLPGAVRGPGELAEHLLHRRDHQPADRPGAGLPQGAGRQDALPGGQRLRLPAHRQQDHQGLRGGQRHGDQGRGVHPAGHTDFSTIDQQDQGRRRRTRSSTRSTATRNVAFFKRVQERRPHRRRHAGALGVVAEEEVGGIGVDNIVGQLVAWNYYQTIDNPENKKFVADFKAKYGADQVTSDPMEAGYTSRLPLEGHGREGRSRSTVPSVKAAAGGVTLRRARRARSRSTATTTTSPRPRSSARSSRTA